jgi:hypothetical protein
MNLNLSLPPIEVVTVASSAFRGPVKFTAPPTPALAAKANALALEYSIAMKWAGERAQQAANDLSDEYFALQAQEAANDLSDEYADPYPAYLEQVAFYTAQANAAEAEAAKAAKLLAKRERDAAQKRAKRAAAKAA